jgi:hypothetical protein
MRLKIINCTLWIYSNMYKKKLLLIHICITPCISHSTIHPKALSSYDYNSLIHPKAFSNYSWSSLHKSHNHKSPAPNNSILNPLLDREGMLLRCTLVPRKEFGFRNCMEYFFRLTPKPFGTKMVPCRH